MSALLKFAARPICFYPSFSKLTGSVNAGVLLSQLFYWYGRSERKFYKTDAEIMEETTLSERELKTAKAKLKELGFLTITREGMPAKTFYDFDLQKMEIELQKAEPVRTNQPNKIGLISRTSSDESAEQDGINKPNIIYTEITTEITTDIAHSAQSVKSAKFDYKKNLVKNGVSEDDAELFMQARKRKRHVNNERAFNMLGAEVLKSGLTMPQAIALCVNRESPWAGFKAEWVHGNKKKGGVAKYAASSDESFAIAERKYASQKTNETPSFLAENENF